MKMLLPLLLLPLFGVSNAFSQTFNWSHQVAGNSEDWAYAVATDGARNSYVTGSFLGAITFPGGCGTFNSFNNTTDIFVAKFDPNGVCLWAKQYGGGGVGGSDEGLSITVDIAGNSYITGYFTATANFGGQSLVSHGQHDVFIAKHLQNGVLQWVVRGGGLGLDSGYGVASGPNLYVTGYVSTNAGSVTFDSTAGAPCTLANVTSSRDVFVVRYNLNGVCQIAKRGGGASQDVGSAISLDAGANAYVIGTFLGSATFGSITVTGSTVNPNTFIAKVDPMLNFLWVKTVSGNARGNSIKTGSSGNSYIAGVFVGTATFIGTLNYTLTSSASSDAFVAKYNVNGVASWARKIGASVAADAYGISVRENCDVFITGSFMGTANFGGFSPLTSSGNRDIFVARYDSNGGNQWAIAAGGSLEDEGRGISVDSFGKASVVGIYKSNPAVFAGTGLNLTNGNTLSRNAFVAKASP